MRHKYAGIPHAKMQVLTLVQDVLVDPIGGGK